jgi:uncharacterized repeat protein (TIGR01451 family)
VVNEPNLTPGVSKPGTGGGTATSATEITGTAATIAPPNATPSTANNFTLIPQSRIEVTKDLQNVVLNPDTTINATFELTVTNPSLERITGITLRDQLAGSVPPRFGTYVAGPPGENEYTIIAAPSGNCGGLNSGFNGSSDTAAASGFALDPGTFCDVFFTLQANPPVNSTVYTNIADVKGTGSLSGQTPEDESNPVNVTAEFTAAIELEKSVGTLPQTPTVKPGDPVKYTFTVRNTGDVRLTAISVTDPLVDNITCPETTLDPGQSTICTGDDYLLTVEDIIAGKVDNTAEAFGQPPKLSTVNDEDSSTTPLPQFALLALNKQYTGYTDNDASGAVSLHHHRHQHRNAAADQCGGER